jgi:hypothetical protein
VNSPLIDISKTEYWQLDRLTGTGNASVSLYWESATASGIDNCADLTIARWNGSSWDERAGTTVSGSSCSGSGTGTIMTNAVVTAFSPFTFGSKSATLNPLPIELISFTANCVPEGALIEWSTATETNSDYYSLERSLDGYTWEQRAKIQAAGRSVTTKEYSFIDTDLPEQVVYYRLSQFDFNRHSEIYPLIYASCTNGNDGLRLYPNPAKDAFSIETNLSQHYGNGLIRIIDPLGTTILEQEVLLAKGRSTFNLPLNLNPGAYTVLIQNARLILPAQRLIIR